MSAQKISRSITGGGISIQEQRSIDPDFQLALKETFAAAKVGSLTTRTDDDTGVLTMAAGHLITTGARLDVYWDVGGVKGCRRGMVVGTVAGNDVPIDLGVGDVLPADESAITAMVPTSYPLAFAGDDLQLLAVHCNARASFVLCEADNTAHLGATQPAKVPYYWDTDLLTTNPVAADPIEKVWLSHGDSSGSFSISLIAGYGN